MPSPALPPDWDTANDPNTGKTYYFNTQTGETSWSFPGDYLPAVAGAPPLSLVARAQSLVDDLNRQPRKEVEACLTPGQLADLDFLQRDHVTEPKSYRSIRPHTILPTAERPLAEETRLESRLHALYRELEKIR